MNRRISLLLAAASLLTAFGCSESPTSSNPPDPEVRTLQPESGRFGLSSLGHLAKRSKAATVKSEPQVTFNLGQIKGSSGFFFLLYNVGMTPITDVTLSIERQGCTVFPTSMDTLIPGSDVGMLPIVKVSAFHGTPYDGVGTRPLLPMGDNTFTLHIQGNSKTASGDDTMIVLDAQLNLEAMTMDLDLETAYGPMNCFITDNEEWHAFPGIEGLNNMTILNGRTQCINDSDIIIRNSGNVPLHLTVYNSKENNGSFIITHMFDSTVAIEDTCQFSFDAGTDGQRILVMASGENTVSDPLKVRLNDDGRFYIIVSRNPGNCEDNVIIQKFNDFKAAHEHDDCAKAYLLLDKKTAFYGQSFSTSDSPVDSLHFSLIDMTTDALITSCTGRTAEKDMIIDTLSAEATTVYETVLTHTDGYTGEYLTIFKEIISSICMNGDSKVKKLEGRINSGSISGEWVRSSIVSFAD